jgi:hypothetical protein
MSWHYLVTWRQYEDERVYGLTEVYRDAEGLLSSWTEEPNMTPIGNDLRDLQGTLTRMQEALARWEPQCYDTLTVGQRIEEKEQ